MNRSVLVLLALAAAGVAGRTHARADECDIFCLRTLLPSCAHASVTCGGTLTCRDGECGSLDATARCFHPPGSGYPSWRAYLDCGERSIESGVEGTQSWSVTYRALNGDTVLTTATLAPPLAARLADDRNAVERGETDLVLRFCPGGVSDPEARQSLVEPHPDFRRDLGRGFYVGLAERGREGLLRLTELTRDSTGSREAIEEELEWVLADRIGTGEAVWFLAVWSGDQVELLVADL